VRLPLLLWSMVITVESSLPTSDHARENQDRHCTTGDDRCLPERSVLHLCWSTRRRFTPRRDIPLLPVASLSSHVQHRLDGIHPSGGEEVEGLELCPECGAAVEAEPGGQDGGVQTPEISVEPGCVPVQVDETGVLSDQARPHATAHEEHGRGVAVPRAAPTVLRNRTPELGERHQADAVQALVAGEVVGKGGYGLRQLPQYGRVVVTLERCRDGQDQGRRAAARERKRPARQRSPTPRRPKEKPGPRRTILKDRQATPPASTIGTSTLTAVLGCPWSSRSAAAGRRSSSRPTPTQPPTLSHNGRSS